MKFIKKIILWIISIFILLTSVIGLIGYNSYKNALETKPLQELVADIKEDENFSGLEELPKIYVNAVIAVEDRRFYTHKGIDIISIGRAVINNIKSKEFAEGGSTITQQVAKNTYFTQKKEITRKVSEAFMALEIEKNYNKEEILEMLQTLLGM